MVFGGVIGTGDSEEEGGAREEDEWPTEHGGARGGEGYCLRPELPVGAPGRRREARQCRRGHPRPQR